MPPPARGSNKPLVKPVGLAAWGGPTLLLMDGTYFIFRAYHALPPLSTRTGVPTHAAYGFTTMLLKALREVAPTHVAVAFDLGGSAARSAMATDYKANRTAPPEDLTPQFDLARRVVRALKIPILEQAGVEADDLLGSLAREARGEGFFTVLLAGDKDFMQIVDEQTLLLDTMYDRWVGPAEVVEKTGVPPDKIVEYMALLGDAIDNIAGIPGVGPKTASQLIQQFGSVDNLLAKLDEVPKEKLRDKLRDHSQGIRLARRLVELQLSLALPFRVAELARQVPDPVELRALFEELEFTRLAREIQIPASNPVGEAAPADAPAAMPRLTFSAPEVLSGAEAATTAIDWYRRQRRLGVQAVLAGSGEHPGELVGVALAAADGKGVARASYLPFQHAGLGGRLSEAAQPALRALLADETVEKVGFGLKQIAKALREKGFHLAGLSFDPELALYLVDPGRREHSLEDALRSHFSIGLPAIEALAATRRKVSLEELAADAVAPHAAASAEAALALATALGAELQRLGLEPLFRELEMPLLPVLAEMEWDGMRVDLGELASLGHEVDAQIAQLEARIYELAGAEFNVASNRQLSEVLFDKLKLNVIRRTKTGPSTDQDVLEKLAEAHPLPAAVLELRQLSKLKGTYIDALPRLVDPRDGRVHTTFNQATAATGRLSSSDPNLQNIPTRTELGKRIRHAFVADPGSVLVSADYNQIELRILAHVSEDEVLREAFARDVDIHTQTAAEVFGVPTAQVTTEMRSAAKAINFGIAYGLSAFGLSQRLELPTKEAQEIIDRYFARYRGVRAWLDATIESARREGSVSTIFGRRRVLGDILSKNFMVRQGAERMAVNTPIQGTAADLIKRAMLRADAALRRSGLAARMTLQVHDELVFETAEKDAEQVGALAREAMMGAGQLTVPLVVSVGTSKDWAGAH